MKKRNLCSDRNSWVPGWRPAFGLLTAVACFGLLQTGCEVDSAGTVDVQIEPKYAEIRQGQAIELTASGWDDYEWSVAKPNLGFLSQKYGRTVVYTATRGADTEQRQDGTNVAQTVAMDTFNTITAAAVVSGSRTNRYVTTMRIKHL